MSRSSGQGQGDNRYRQGQGRAKGAKPSSRIWLRRNNCPGDWDPEKEPYASPATADHARRRRLPKDYDAIMSIRDDGRQNAQSLPQEKVMVNW